MVSLAPILRLASLMLEIRDLWFDFPDKPLLRQVQCVVNAGTVLHLRGGNGKGKTTLLKLLAGLLHPLRGGIFYNGCSITDNLSAYQQNLCYVGHKTGLNSFLTVRENCHFELRYARSSLSFEALMHCFPLTGLEDVMTGLLSAGQQRQLGLLRLFMSDASLWLLDEPLNALDTNAIDCLMQAVTKHREQGGSVVFTSHQSLPLPAKEIQEYCL